MTLDWIILEKILWYTGSVLGIFAGVLKIVEYIKERGKLSVEIIHYGNGITSNNNMTGIVHKGYTEPPLLLELTIGFLIHNSDKRPAGLKKISLYWNNPGYTSPFHLSDIRGITIKGNHSYENEISIADKSVSAELFAGWESYNGKKLLQFCRNKIPKKTDLIIEITTLKNKKIVKKLKMVV
jgi:hypothetical protein